MDKSLSNNKKTMDFYDSLLDYFDDLNKYQAKVGVHASAGRKNVKKAISNEFGKITALKKPLKKQLANGQNITLPEGTILQTPPRPFIRLFLYQDLVDSLVKDTVDYIDVVLTKKKIKVNDARDTYKRIGTKALDLMHSKMEYKGFDNSENFTTKDTEHNAPLTIAIKGKDDPLFDTGELYDVMESKVRKRSGGL